MQLGDVWFILIIMSAMMIVTPLALWQLAWMGGWRQLTQAFPKVESTGAKRIGLWKSASFCHVNYSNCVVLHVDEAYLHVSMLLPFRIGHAPMSIPWAEVRMKPVRYFFWVEVMQMTFPNVPGVRMRMSIPLAMQLIRTAREMGGRSLSEIPDELE